MYVQRLQWSVFVPKLLQWKINKYYTFWVCVCSLRCPASNAHVPYCHLWPVWLQNIFSTFSHKRHNFRGKKLLSLKCVLWFPLKLLSAISFILRRTERDIIKKIVFLFIKVPVIFVRYLWKFFSLNICENKMPTRCNRLFLYCRSYCLLNMFRAPLCPSSGAQEYYSGGCCLWYLLLCFSSCWSSVELGVVCPVFGMVQHPANRSNLFRGYSNRLICMSVCCNFTFVWPCIVPNTLFIIKPTRCTNFTNLFWHETLHVSDSSSVHHQEFIHCTLSNGICHTGL